MGACRICGSAATHREFIAREMMYGTREEFRYRECSDCGSLQIADIPPDIARYYPADYYSFAPPRRRGRLAPLAEALRRLRLRAALGETSSSLARALAARFPPPPYVAEWFRPAGVRIGSRILEAGCGNGVLLTELASQGFRDLTGVDPFVTEDLAYPPAARVLKRRLEDLDGSFDFAMIHHAFEHMADPFATLAALRRLLPPGGRVLLRVPVAAGAWEEYGPDWVQLDAPRHLHLVTEAGMAALAGRAGFSVMETVFDSTAFQFWGSEQYRRGIPLRDPRSHAVNSAKSPFSLAELAGFEARAAEWNSRRRGDQACFFLQAA